MQVNVLFAGHMACVCVCVIRLDKMPCYSVLMVKISIYHFILVVKIVFIHSQICPSYRIDSLNKTAIG